MVMQIVCSCGRRLQSSVARPGQLCLCPVCKQTLVFPEEDNPAPTAAQPTAVAPSPLMLQETISDAEVGTPPRTAFSEPTIPREENPLVPALVSPATLTRVAMVGGPASGLLALGRNERCLGQHRRGNCIIAFAFVFQTAVIAGLVCSPTTAYVRAGLILFAVLWIAAIPIISALGRSWYRQATRHARPMRTFPDSRTTVVLFTVPVLVGSILVFVMTHMIVDDAYSLSGFSLLKSTPNDRVYYSQEIPQSYAEATAVVLRDSGYFGHGEGKSVRLRCETDQVVVDFLLEPSGWENPHTVDHYRELGKTLSTRVFRSIPLQINLCDASYKCRCGLRIVTESP